MRIFRDLLYYSMLISAYNLKIFSRRRFNIANYLSSSATTSPRVPPPGLVGHVKVMMIQGLDLWQGSKDAKIDAADGLSKHLLSEYARESVTGGDASSNKNLFEKAKYLHKACRSRAQFISKELDLHRTMLATTNEGTSQISCSVDKLLDGTLSVDDIFKDYEKYLARNRAVYNSISSRHEGLKTKHSACREASSLESYADAATKMGAKKWVNEANEHMWHFALSFLHQPHAFII